MKDAEVKHIPLSSDPIVIEESPSGPVPFLTRFAKKPEIRKHEIRMGGQTYLGSTKPGVGDYLNDDQ